MKRTTLRRASGLAALALTDAFGLAACGGDADSDERRRRLQGAVLRRR